MRNNKFRWSRSAQLAWVWFGLWILPGAVLEASATSSLGFGALLAVPCFVIGAVPIGMIVHSEAG